MGPAWKCSQRDKTSGSHEPKRKFLPRGDTPSVLICGNLISFCTWWYGPAADRLGCTGALNSLSHQANCEAILSSIPLTLTLACDIFCRSHMRIAIFLH